MLQAIFEVLLETFLQVFCGLTGHGLLWGLTLGRWKMFNGRDDAAMFVGILFWALIGVGFFFLLRS